MFLTIFYIKQFYEPNYFYKLILIYCKLNYCNSNSTLAGITSIGITTSHKTPPLLHFLQNQNECHIWHNFVLFLIKIYFLAFFIFLSIGLFIKFNLKLYFKKVKIKRKKRMPNHFSKNKISLITQIISISICKLVLVCIIYLALKTKPELKTDRHEEKRLNYKAYFLSPEYFKDIYKINDNHMRHLLKWHCLSKLKLTSFKYFYQTLLLLSGDIALNQGLHLTLAPNAAKE